MTTVTKYQGEYAVKAPEHSIWETNLTEDMVETILTTLGIPGEEITIAVGLLQSASHDYVDFDANNRAVIDDAYGEML